MAEQITELRQRRLIELEKQATLFGPRTDPAILIEIQELRNQERQDRVVLSPQKREELDRDWLANIVAAALQRLTIIEQKVNQDANKRILRQLIHDIWMIAITVIALVNLFLLLSK